MTVIVAGDFKVRFHEAALADALEAKGIKVIRVPYFTSRESLVRRFQIKYSCGPVINEVANNVLTAYRRHSQVDAVFFYRPRLVSKKVIAEIRKRTKTIAYNNDSAFGNAYPFYFWRILKQALRSYSHLCAYRESDIAEYVARGCCSVSVLLPFYQKTRTFPIRGIGPNKFTCDVGFIGHYEDDGRHLLFEEMIANGIKLGIWGPNWKKAPNYKKLCFLMQRDITEITSEYNLAINSCKIAMAIYSRLNRDCYTRRSFEIPSTAVCMLSERTAAMERMFAEGREAVYFDRSGESHKVIRALLNEPARIKAIGKAGLNALLRGGHEASDRASEIVELISALKA